MHAQLLLSPRLLDPPLVSTKESKVNNREQLYATKRKEKLVKKRKRKRKGKKDGEHPIRCVNFVLGSA
jgi:hypothetical protein